FQAEDGIRDLTVTGVQTCALPIWPQNVQLVSNVPPAAEWFPKNRSAITTGIESARDASRKSARSRRPVKNASALSMGVALMPTKIGRASCRERVEIAVVGGACKRK